MIDRQKSYSPYEAMSSSICADLYLGLDSGPGRDQSLVFGFLPEALDQA